MMSSSRLSPTHLLIPAFSNNHLTFVFLLPQLAFQPLLSLLDLFSPGVDREFGIDFSFCFVNEFIVWETLWGRKQGLF